MGNELLFQVNARTNLELFGALKFRRLMVTNRTATRSSGRTTRTSSGRVERAPVRGRERGAGGRPARALAGDPGGGDLGAVAYHDSCFYGRYNGIYEEQRALVQRSGGKLVELPRNREGLVLLRSRRRQLLARGEGAARVLEPRRAEVMATGAPTLAVSCPFCMAMLEDGLKAQEGFEAHPVKVRHVVELVAEAIGKGETAPH